MAYAPSRPASTSLPMKTASMTSFPAPLKNSTSLRPGQGCEVLHLFPEERSLLHLPRALGEILLDVGVFRVPGGQFHETVVGGHGLFLQQHVGVPLLPENSGCLVVLCPQLSAGDLLPCQRGKTRRVGSLGVECGGLAGVVVRREPILPVEVVARLLDVRGSIHLRGRLPGPARASQGSAFSAPPPLPPPASARSWACCPCRSRDTGQAHRALPPSRRPCAPPRPWP